MMNTVDKQFFIEHGYKEDTNGEKLAEVFRNKTFKNVYVDVNKGTMLLARFEEKDVDVNPKKLSFDDSYIISKNDTMVICIEKNEIKDILYEEYKDEGYYIFEFEIKNIKYSLRITV